MMAISFIISSLSVCAFYVYVLLQLRREERRETRHKKLLAQHLLEISASPEKQTKKAISPAELNEHSDKSNSSRRSVAARRETMLSIGLSIGWLLAVFAGIEVLNSLLTRFRWY